MKARELVAARRRAHETLVSDWKSLELGEPVEVFKDAQVVACGRIEEVSSSGMVLWLVGQQALNHRNFLKSDGVLIHRA
jgi:hypothetical protein